MIYCDNAATRPVSQEVLEAMLPYLKDHYGNASSIYSIGREAKRALEGAREQAAKGVGANTNEIYFTGSGTEADNWALRSVMEVMKATKGKNHLITTNIEHHAVLHTAEYLEKNGFEVTYLPVNAEGYVNADQLKEAIKPTTGLVSIMYANNEIGTIQPIKELAAVCKEAGVLFHTDAVQAVGNVPINVAEEGIDMLTLSGHKLQAMKGVGALYVRRGILLPNLIFGGAQERNRRGGTENIPGIVGMGRAVEIATAHIDEKAAKVTPLRDKLIKGLLELPRTRLNGGMSPRLPGNVNISIEGVEGESLLLSLDIVGIAASSGSACTSGSLDPSHVLLALGLKHEVAHGSLRFSLSDLNTDEEIDTIIKESRVIVERLRAMSPLWERMMKEEG